MCVLTATRPLRLVYEKMETFSGGTPNICWTFVTV